MVTISAASFSPIPGQTSPNPEENAAEILLIAPFLLISQALAFSLATRYLQRVATFPLSNQSPLFQRFHGIAIGRRWAQHFVTLQTAQHGITAERIGTRPASTPNEEDPARARCARLTCKRLWTWRPPVRPTNCKCSATPGRLIAPYAPPAVVPSIDPGSTTKAFQLLPRNPLRTENSFPKRTSLQMRLLRRENLRSKSTRRAIEQAHRAVVATEAN
jgi:hypothetical protein